MNKPLNTAKALAAAWKTLVDEEPKLRIRDAAARLGASEAQLLATETGAGVTRLDCRPAEMLPAFKEFGHVMVLTRNDGFVHEREGTFRHVQVDGPVGLVLGPDIDLRCFLMHWKSAFAVRKETPRGLLQSIQFFDGHGDAVFKVYLREDSVQSAYDAFVDTYASAEQGPELAVAPRPAPEVPKADEDIDVDGFRAAWLGMQDTHEFFGMLREFGVARTQALRLAPEGHADPLPVGSFEALLEAAAEAETPIMVFVGSRGCIQIHTGKVQRLKKLGDWFNVLDPEFNLHAKLPTIASAWRVRKPTEDGVVTSLELFDEHGETLAMLFGERKPGKPELPEWRALVEAL